MTIYSLDGLLFLFGTSLLFHVQFSLLLSDLHTDFSGGMSGGLVFPSVSKFPQFFAIHTVKGFGIVNKAEIYVFSQTLVFLKIQWMLAILSLVPLPFLNPAWTSGSSPFRCYWSPGWEDFEHWVLHYSWGGMFIMSTQGRCCSWKRQCFSRLCPQFGKNARIWDCEIDFLSFELIIIGVLNNSLISYFQR